jgi:hypothetical protein
MRRTGAAKLSLRNPTRIKVIPCAAARNEF